MSYPSLAYTVFIVPVWVMFWDCMPTYLTHLVWMGGQEAICVFPNFLSIPSFFIPGATGGQNKDDVLPGETANPSLTN